MATDLSALSVPELLAAIQDAIEGRVLVEEAQLQSLLEHEQDPVPTDGPPPLSLATVLEEAMREEYRDHSEEVYVRPSNLGVALGPEHAACGAAFWHRSRGAPTTPLSAGQMLMFKMGDLVHEYMVELLRKYLPRYGWYVVDRERPTEAFGIGGTYDVKIRHFRTGWTRIVDFKTKRGNAFNYLNEAKPDNVLQTQFYVAAEDADDGSLLYVDREGQNFVREFPVPRNDARPEEGVRRMCAIRDADEPPPPVGLRIQRKRNKGPDSVYLNVPWQVEWCHLEECYCAGQLPGNVPDKIVAKISNDGVVSSVEGYEEWLDTVLALLRADFPDETFMVDGELELEGDVEEETPQEDAPEEDDLPWDDADDELDLD